MENKDSKKIGLFTNCEKIKRTSPIPHQEFENGRIKFSVSFPDQWGGENLFADCEKKKVKISF